MQAKAAAHYLGVSASKVRTLGIPVKVSGANRLYDIRDLDEYADRLPYVDGDGTTSDADEAWGAPNNGLNSW
jgi:hypothetical protein